MTVSQKDKEILRRLAGELAQIAALPVQKAKADLWRRLNRLEKVRPLVWINEVCWAELAGPELDLQTSAPLARSVEENLRQILYQWKHFPADMVVDANIWCPIVIHDTGYGLENEEVRSAAGGGAADYVPVIRTEADVEKIQMPRITVDWNATQRNLQQMQAIFDGIMPVRTQGIYGTWFAPWDRLIQYYGITELYMDMLDRPALVHAAIGRMVDAMLCRFDQYEQLGVLELNNANYRVGAGGLGFSDQLPAGDFDGEHVRMIDMWGNSVAQIFSEVSPEMHEEFALRHELRILERFGLNCYGCCEPLHRKVKMLERIPRLRRISMSPFVNWREGAEAVGERYVFSAKPQPALLAGNAWHGDQVRQYLRDLLEATRGCRVEIIQKDVSTLRNEPRRLDEWSRIAMEMVEDFAP